MALAAIALSWAGEASAHQEVNDWNLVMAQMEPLSGFFMHSRLAPLMHVAIHDAMNAIPETARFHTYRPPVTTQGPASPEAALAAAGRTMALNYIAFYSDPNLPPPFYNPVAQDILPQVESVYAAQLSAIPDGPAKTEGIRVGEETANGLWNERLGDGWNNPSGLTFDFPNSDGDNNPMTGLPGEYVMLDPADTFAGVPQPFFYWWGDMAPWTMTANDQFLSKPPPSPTSGAFLNDVEELRLYGEDTSTVRTPEQSFTAIWWEFCPGSGLPATYTIGRQLTEDFELDNYDAARVLALAVLAQADATISNVNSKNVNQFWRPITAVNYYYPGSDWKPYLLTSPNQEYPAGHPMLTGAALHMLTMFFGSGPLDNPIIGTSECGDLVFGSLKDAIESVINARVWGGVHYRSSGEVGAKIGKDIAHHVYKDFLTPL